MLDAVCCMLCAVWCILYAVCCMLCAVCYMLYAVCCVYSGTMTASSEVGAEVWCGVIG